MADIFLVISFSIALVELFLANYLFYEDPRDLLHQLAAARCLMASLFAFGTFFLNIALNDEAARFWEKARAFPFVILIGLLFHFSLSWSGWDKRRYGRTLIILVYAFSIVLLSGGFFFFLLGNPVKDLFHHYTSSFTDLPVSIFTFWAVAIFLFSFLWIIISYARMPRESIRLRDKFILAGYSTFFLTAIVGGIMPHYYFPQFPTVIPIGCLFADILVTVGISRDRPFFLAPMAVLPQVVTALHESVVLTDCKGLIEYVNPILSRWTGFPMEAFLGKPLKEIFLGPAIDPAQLERLCTGQLESIERRLKNRTGSISYVSISASHVIDKQGKRYGVVYTLTDMTSRRNTEKARRDSEKRFRELFEDSPISVWEEDFSLLKKKLAELHANHVKDLRLYMVEHPQFIQECAGMIHVLDVNKASIKLFEAHNKRQLLGVSSRLIPDVAKTMFVEELVSMWEGKTEFEMEGINHTLAGRRMYVNVRWTIPPDYQKTWSRVLVLVTDITPRKTAEMERARLFDELQQMAIVDSLTGVYNRRYFLAMAQNEVELAKKYGNAVSTIMIDLDLFKNVNDRFGHNFGDKVLGLVAMEIKKSLRKVDILCRYGGDEFMILLPDVEENNAVKTAERIRERIFTKAFEVDENIIELSASMGVAQLSAEVNNLDAILTCADVALYAAKSKGRNRVVVWSPELRQKNIKEKRRGLKLSFIKKVKQVS
jgi:diguanylate cyclase (GGDEF)-like protein/PAS domain S-box-containing protein